MAPSRDAPQQAESALSFVTICTIGHPCAQEERLPLWLRPYEVLVTSARTALIEFVPNTASIHAIKAKSPPRTSLRDHYLARFGPVVSTNSIHLGRHPLLASARSVALSHHHCAPQAQAQPCDLLHDAGNPAVGGGAAGLRREHGRVQPGVLPPAGAARHILLAGFRACASSSWRTPSQLSAQA
jgi:hypothetical protein